MRAHSAAPEGLLVGTSGRRIDRGSTARITQLGLASHLVARLESEGVETLADWKRLGGRRLGIFGVTRRVVAYLDAAAAKETGT